MKKAILVLLVTLASASTSAIAASSVTEILGTNKAATGGESWTGKITLKADYDYSGQGLTGTTSSVTDLRGGRWADTFAIGPLTGANGFDGKSAWAKDTSGTVTIQEGGEQRALAVNEGYRRANLWWQPGFSGAAITTAGERKDNSGTFDVLTVTPKDGKSFDAWFDAKSHLLSRILEKQGPLTVTTALSAYRAVDGVQLPGKLVVDDGRGAKYIQTLTLKSATFEPALPDSAYAKPNVTVTDFSIAAGAKETTLPIKIINNHIYGYAKVNGQGPYLFIFDTGGANLVTPATAKQLGLPVQGKAPGGGAGEGTVDVGFTKVESLQVGDATIKNQVFPVLDFIAPGVEGVDETGMVGFETFRRFVTRIDYGKSTLTLINPKAFDPTDAGTPVHFVFNQSIPEVEGSFEGIPARFDVDTGSRAELTLTKPFAEKNGLRAKHPKGVDTVDGWGVGGPSRAYVTRGATMTVGPVKIDNVVTAMATQKKGAFAGGEYQGNIGGGILKRFVVTFDYDHQIMYLKPLPEPVADTGTFDRAGMWFNQGSNGFKVVDVTANSPAAKAGLEPGDLITLVDGVPAKTMALYDLRKRLRNDAPGMAITFGIKRGKETKVVPVILRDLI